MNYRNMAGKAVLHCRHNSYPFMDRTLTLNNIVKIGRCDSGARASHSNGVFNCKVLSRNHALIWYHNGKFYLQDTKSSNGTFVNSQRLSKSGEESFPWEVSSGDIVQFGINVLENARKITHECIIADLKLYLPDGKEANASSSKTLISGVGSVSIDDFYMLNEHIQEALQREQMLQTKLSSLQQLVLSLRQATDLGLKSLIAEDRLLSRIDLLENRLQTYTKNFVKEDLHGELRKPQENKSENLGLDNDCLQKVFQEKPDAVQKCQDIKRVLLNTVAECTNLKEIIERDHEGLQELSLKHNSQVMKTMELQKELLDSEEQHKNVVSRLGAENEKLNNEVKRLLANEVVMHEKSRQLESSGDNVGEQLLGVQNQLHIKCSPDINDHLPTLKQGNEDIAADICKINEKGMKAETEEDLFIIQLASEHKKTKDIVQLITAQVSLLENEKMCKLEEINSLEAELELQVDKLYKYKEDNRELEHCLQTLERRLEEENVTKMDTIINSMPKINGSEQFLDGLQPSNKDSLQNLITEVKKTIKESQSKMKALEGNIDLIDEGLNNAKKELSNITKSLLLQDEKLKDVQGLNEDTEASQNVSCEEMKTLQCSVLQWLTQEKLKDESDHTIQHKEIGTLLMKQLLEAQKNAKQNKDEAELLKEKLHEVLEELELTKSVTKNNRIKNKLDNNAVEELAAAKLEAASLQTQIVSLESHINNLGMGSTLKQYEEELVLAKEKYIACNKNNIQLEKEFTTLKQDYVAVVHEPYFNVLFGLPLLVLIIAIVCEFYPTLALLMGTSDPA